eukprot:comp12132_c0_seq1/m.6873 comp12132_c0_seq1/g.6873  ORF comp12132_c0_seq1/g.6873 comp12132_c0_seq1/m.6873 type:complete len:173 (-) comp12132_c0_seq1:310-828(-)
MFAPFLSSFSGRLHSQAVALPTLLRTTPALFHSSTSLNKLKVVGGATKKAKAKAKIEPEDVCVAHVNCTFNNTIVTFTRLNGDAINTISAGMIGYKKGKRKSPFAGQMAATEAAQKAFDMGVRQAHIKVKGLGKARNTAIKGLAAVGIKLLTITDVTGVPHNGCRPPKARRL